MHKILNEINIKKTNFLGFLKFLIYKREYTYGYSTDTIFTLNELKEYYKKHKITGGIHLEENLIEIKKLIKEYRTENLEDDDEKIVIEADNLTEKLKDFKEKVEKYLNSKEESQFSIRTGKIHFQNQQLSSDKFSADENNILKKLIKAYPEAVPYNQLWPNKATKIIQNLLNNTLTNKLINELGLEQNKKVFGNIRKRKNYPGSYKLNF